MRRNLQAVVMTAIDEDEEAEVVKEWRKTWDKIHAEFSRLTADGVGRDLAARMAYDEVILERIKP